MAMFDWNDEELTNIIWGEARESDDDDIVPYPDQNEENHPILSDPTKKDMNHEIARVSPIEQKKPCTNTEHGVEVVGSCKYGIHDPPSKGFSNARPDGSDLAITNFERVDQDSVGTAASNNMNHMMTTKDATGKIDKVSGFLQNPLEDREQGDFVDYGWENIGSFDDLDRIFRNDPICGVMNDGSVDEPWLSFQGVTSRISILTPTSGDSCDMPLVALNSLDRSEIGAEFTLDSCHSFASVSETFKEIKSHVGQDEQTFEIGEKSEACQKKSDGGKAAIMNELSEKLDIQIRLSIRDSLFRLAQSAIQRQYPSNTGSIKSRDEVLSKDIDTHERTSTISDEETDTNPIDRTVAHLLFRRPLELSGKLSKKHDSPISAYMLHERKPRTLKSIEKGHFPDTFEKAQVESPDGSKTFRVYFDKDQSKNSPCLDTPQVMSNIEAATSGKKCL